MSKEIEQVLTMLTEGKISVDEATRLLERLQPKQYNDPALGSQRDPGQIERTTAVSTTRRPTYLRVLVVDGDSDKVDIRVPLKLVRLGAKFSEMVPEPARDAIAAQGVDLSGLGDISEDEFYEAIGDLRVDIEDGEDKVQIFCE